MKTLFLLVLLSRNGAGDINASFINTPTLVQCQQKESMVKGIFSAAKIPIVASRCVSNNLQFSAFSHTNSSKQPRHFYLIHLAGDTKEGFAHAIREESKDVQIQKMPDWHTCMSQQQQSLDRGDVYCSSSIQYLK